MGSGESGSRGDRAVVHRELQGDECENGKKMDGDVNLRPLNRKRQLMGRKLLFPRRFVGWATTWRRDIHDN
jgi:hypothetical protein